jgi:hypothetical protein
MPYTQTQPSLPYASQSETSHEAAMKARSFSGEQAFRVLAFIRWNGADGCTQKEAEQALEIGRPSLCARFRELEQAGQIVKTAKRRQGCVVYKAMT